MQEQPGFDRLDALDAMPSTICSSGLPGSTARREPSSAECQSPGLSYQLRTSLAIVTLLSGNLDLLYERLDDEKRRRMIRDIRKQTQTLTGIVTDVLEPHGEEATLPV